MKRITLIFSCLLLLGAFAYGQESSASDVTIYNEVVSAFKTGFYPGAIEKANLLERKYPNSIYVLSAQIYKSEALVNIQNYSDAVETLNVVSNKIHSGSDDFIKINFLQGKANFYLKNYVSASNFFHTVCSSSLTEEVMTYYYPSVLYAARIFYVQENFEKAVPLFEYVIQNGSNYHGKDFDETVQKLLTSYNQTENFRKSVYLYNSFAQNDFSPDVYSHITMFAAESYEGLHDYEMAYKLYSNIVESENKSLAVIALKKAYIMATESNGTVDADDVFAKANDIFKDMPEMLNEFWIRLGIDKYEKKDYSSALDYFAKVEDEKNPVIAVYKAKIILDTKKSNEDVERAEEVLESAGEYTDAHYSLMIQCKALKANWREIPDLYQKIQNPTDEDYYLYVCSFYREGDFEEVCRLAELRINDDVKNAKVQLTELYASALSKLGRFEKACTVYEKLQSANQLSENAKYEYAKVLFALKKYNASYKICCQLNQSEALYLKAICLINLKNWKLAKENFIEYIKNNSNADNFNSFALFYKGYAEYNLEEYKNAYASFIRYCTEKNNFDRSYVRQSYEYAAKSALQNGDLKNAAIQAENVIKNSTELSEKQQAAMFASEIYADSANYGKAIDVLTPFTKDGSDFAMESKFQIAKIYSKQKKIKDAERVYVEVYTNCADTTYAEDAMYRCAELFYSENDYATAENRFNNYIYKYVNGKYSDSAFFFCADCNFRLGAFDKSIMLNENFLQKYPSSIYVYGCYKNLLSAYYEKEDFEKALSTAKTLVSKFPEQSKDDGINRRVTELERIVSGTDTKISEKISQYEKAGKSGSKNGRVIGSELVQLYAANADSQKEAFDLASEILEKQKDADELYYAAKNAEFIAEYYRKNQENQKSAASYLKSAEYYRSVAGEENNAARVLYGAVDAFVAAGLKGDAKETAGLLKELYPQSVQAQRVNQLIK